jgi:hypothetical protein
MTLRYAAAFAALLVFPAVFPAAVSAQDEMRAAPKCDAVAAPPPALAGWSSKADLSAAAKPADLAAASLTVDHAASVSLHPTHDVAYITQPDKPGGSVAHGGLLAIVIDKAGTYQINLSSGAWIDLVKDGKTVLSTAHAPGPACTGIRKTVQFPLEPGHYVLQISANADPTIAVMISKAS